MPVEGRPVTPAGVERLLRACTRDWLANYRMAIAAFNASPKEEVEHT